MPPRAVALPLVLCATSVAAWDDIVRHVNSNDRGWEAAAPTRFRNVSDLAGSCGTYLRGHPRYVAPAALAVRQWPRASQALVGNVSLPSAFDARVQWPGCTAMRLVRDQSGCGGCWAFASTATFGARMCTQLGRDLALSPEDTLSCCTDLTYGCGGGLPWSALIWMSADGTGVVTGGLFGRADGCKPYSYPPCAHLNAREASYPPCSGGYPTPVCTAACRTGYPTSYLADKHKGGVVYRTGNPSAGMIKQALLGGPVAVTMTVYEDFATYRGGVYRHVYGGIVGGHSVMLIGWGADAGTPYWLAQNSWNNEWGEGGYFRIAFGECNIEIEATFVDFDGLDLAT